MARDIESLTLRMSADLRRFEKSMDAMRQTADRRLNEVERRALQSQKNLSRIMERAGTDMVASLRAGLAEVAPTLAAAFSAAQVVKYADAWTNGRNALAAAGVATADLAERQSDLVDLANETRTSFETTIGLYRRLSIANEELGLSQTSVLRLTELVNKSFQTSGSTTQEAAAAALQLSQALASGVLQGDELRSIRENAPQLAQAIAKAMGVGIGELKKLGAEGKITAQVVASAIIGAGDQIEAKFAATQVSVGQALTILDNQLGRFVGQTDAGLSATRRMAQGIVGLANHLDDIIPVVGTLATFFGVQYAGGLAVAGARTAAATMETVRYQLALIALQARQTGTTSAQVALNAAMAANPIGLVVTVVAALAAGLFILASRYNSTAVAARELDRVVGAADTALSDYAKAVDEARNASDKERVALERKAAALRAVTAARINDAKVAAQKQTDEAVALGIRAHNARGDADALRSRNANNFSNAATSVVIGADAQARGAESLAARARDEAKAATDAYERLKAAMNDIENPRPASNGGGGGGGAVGDAARAARSQADDLRRDLEAIQDSLLTDAERAARLLADRAETIRKAVAGGLITSDEGARLEAGAAAVDLKPFDRTEISPLGREAFEIADSLRDGAAAAADELEARSRDMARGFVDILAADDWAQAAGSRFRDAAFNGLEDLLTNLFKSLSQSEGGGIFGTLGSALFGGFRAGGGPVSAGRAYVVGERRPELFVPNTAGTIIPSVNAAMAGMKGGGGSQNIRVSINLEGANGDETIRQIAYEAAARGVGVAIGANRATAAHAQRRARQSFIR